MEASTDSKDFNNLILLRLQLAPLGEREVADGKLTTFVAKDEYSDGFALRMPVSEWQALGSPDTISFGVSTLGLSVSSRDHNLRLYDDSRRLVRFIPMSDEGKAMLEKISDRRWTEPYQLRIIEGELELRGMKQIAGIEDSGYEAWSPMDGLSA